MGAKNNDGLKITYFNLKTKSAKFEQYVKNGDNLYFDKMENILLEKVGRRKKQIQNGPIFWEYCLLFSDIDDNGAKIMITIPNFGNTLFKFFAPLLSLDSIAPLDFSPYSRNEYFKLAVRIHGEQDTVKYPFEWDADEKWFKGVPKVKWIEAVKDGIEYKESDDTLLKEFILDNLKEWCNNVLGSPFQEAEIDEKLFSNNTTRSSSKKNPAESTTEKGNRATEIIAHYSKFEDMVAVWGKIVAKVATENAGDEMGMDYFFRSMEDAVIAKFGLINVVCDKDTLRGDVDDLPF